MPVVRAITSTRSSVPASPFDDDIRRRLEAVVEWALDILDMIDADNEGDGNVDLEDDGGAEPSLAAPEASVDRLDQRQWARGADDDRELVPGERRRRPARAGDDQDGFVELRPGFLIRFHEAAPLCELAR